MVVRYRLIDHGRVIAEQSKEYDGPLEANTKLIESDVYDDMDVLQLARTGEKARWIEASVKHGSATG